MINKTLRRFVSVKFVEMWLLFIVLSFAIYFPAIRGGFIWDDTYSILRNPAFRSSQPLVKIWLGRQVMDYWPLSYTVLWLEWRFFGESPVGYHIVNLLIHALVCTLIWRILSRLKFSHPLLVAFVFCIHPLNVEAVAWIFQLKTLLATMLVLLSTLFYIENKADHQRFHYSMALAAFICANLAKISIVTWPFVLLGLEWYLARYLNQN